MSGRVPSASPVTLDQAVIEAHLRKVAAEANAQAETFLGIVRELDGAIVKLKEIEDRARAAATACEDTIARAARLDGRPERELGLRMYLRDALALPLGSTRPNVEGQLREAVDRGMVEAGLGGDPEAA